MVLNRQMNSEVKDRMSLKPKQVTKLHSQQTSSTSTEMVRKCLAEMPPHTSWHLTGKMAFEDIDVESISEDLLGNPSWKEIPKGEYTEELMRRVRKLRLPNSDRWARVFVKGRVIGKYDYTKLVSKPVQNGIGQIVEYRDFPTLKGKEFIPLGDYVIVTRMYSKKYRLYMISIE